MMIEWTITTYILGSAAALILFFWTKIVEFFSGTIIPWIRKYMSDKVADSLAEIIIFIDKGVVAVKKGVVAVKNAVKNAVTSTLSTIKEYWIKLHKYILKKEREYIDIGNGKYTLIDTTYLPCENDSKSAQKITHQSEIEWEDVPAEVRDEQIRKNAQKMKLDDKKVMEHKLLESAEKNGVSKKALLELEC